jgi:hypothetical protein
MIKLAVTKEKKRFLVGSCRCDCSAEIYRNVSVLEDGFSGWAQRGFSVVSRCGNAQRIPDSTIPDPKFDSKMQVFRDSEYVI